MRPVFACVQISGRSRVPSRSGPGTMLLQLRADESDVIVCGSMARSREPSELDDYMS